jgi:hypothetical protein
MGCSSLFGVETVFQQIGFSPQVPLILRVVLQWIVGIGNSLCPNPSKSWVFLVALLGTVLLKPFFAAIFAALD